MKKLIIPLIAVAIFIIAVGILLQRTGILPTTNATPPSATISIDGKTINLEVARTTDERTKGLSGRVSLDANSGMLFVFGQQDKIPTFWMKDMLIPLDIIWISDNKIIRIDKDVLAPAVGTPDNKLKTYSAGVKVNYVLEVNAGFSDSNLIKVGDSVSISGV